MATSTHDLPKPKAPRVSKYELSCLWVAYWEQPDDERRNALVEAYQGLVRTVLGRFASRYPRSVDRGDLTTAANVGLMSAVASFDPARRVRFESYCEMRIRGALLDEMRSQDWLPRPWRQRVESQKRAVETLRSELGREPADEDVAGALGMALEQYQHYFGVSLPDAPSGSMPSGPGEDEAASRLDILEDPRLLEPGEQLTRDEILRLVAQRLTEQEYRIVYLKYWEELSMREIGAMTNLSESRVCKIHMRLLSRLQDRFAALGN